MWTSQAKHCPVCGARLIAAMIESRRRKRCPDCSFVLFANPASAAAGLVLNPQCQVLLVRRAIQPFRGSWALPAGYQEIDEAPEATIAREILEEAGVEVRVLGLLDLIFVGDDPRKPANVALYLCRLEAGVPRAGGDVSDARWFDLDRLPDDIGFDNRTWILGRLTDRARWPRTAWSLLSDLLGPAAGEGSG